MDAVIARTLAASACGLAVAGCWLTSNLQAGPSESAGSGAAASSASSTGGGSGASGGGAPTLVNGEEYSGFLPFASTSPWNTRVTNPSITSYSAALVATQFADGNTKPVRSSEPGAFDYAFSIVYAKKDDPVVALGCEGGGCNHSDNGGIPSTIHIPAKARPPGWGGAGCTMCVEDAQLAIIQPDGIEIDTSGGSNYSPGVDWTDGMTFTVTGAANCGAWLPDAAKPGTGFVNGGAAPAGNCFSAGQLRASELLAGSIQHALVMALDCTGGQAPVNPASPSATGFTCSDGASGGPPVGAHIWYDVPCATTSQSTTLARWEKAILCALNEYGAYYLLTGGGSTDHVRGMFFTPSAGEMFYDFGKPNPYKALADTQGWQTIPQDQIPGAHGDRYVGADPWQPQGVDFATHMHYIEPPK